MTIKTKTMLQKIRRELWNTVVFFPLDLGNKHKIIKIDRYFLGLDSLGLEPETVPASCGGFLDF